MDVSVARCSEGNISCKIALVRTCKASSSTAAINPPNAIIQHMPECSVSSPIRTSNNEMVNIHLYFILGTFNINLEPTIPPISINKSANPSHHFDIPDSGSFACKKNNNRISMAPTNELHSFKKTYSTFSIR